MDNKIEYSKPVPPFVRFCAANIPMVFDDSLSYYEALCALWKWLQTDVIDVINNNARVTQVWREELTTFENNITDSFDLLSGKFDELKYYVEHYFDNLDVQEEINNKLDQMTEDGILQEIITTYIQSNVTWTFENVSAMTSATNLTAGSFARTLGYYNRGDGGGATYKIIASSDADSNHFYETIDTNLKAELQFEDGVININALGSDNTGTNDSSSVFNSAFTFINAQWLAGNYNVNTVRCEGKYKWTSQVTMPPCARLRSTGYVTILTDVTGSALKIDYLSTSTPSGFDGNKQDWEWAELINFDRGGIFKNVGTDLTNTCIEIGRNSDIGSSLPYARYKLCNFRIYNYAIGMLHNRFHNYLGKFDNISFESNATGVQYGVAGASVVDSGENFTYNNCLFASGTNALVWYTDGFDSSFINCSFDFITNCFNEATNNGYTRIVASNCHFEGFSYIGNNIRANDYVFIEGSSFVFLQNGSLFNNFQNSSIVTLKNNKILPTSANIKDPTKLVDTASRIGFYQNVIGHDSLYYGVLQSNLISTGFDKVADGSVTVTEGSTIGKWKVTGSTGNFSGEVRTDNYLYTGHKSLVLSTTVDTATAKNFNLEYAEFVPISNFRQRIYGNVFHYNVLGSGSFGYRFYDENKQLIGDNSGYHYIQAGTVGNTWYMSPYSSPGHIPSNACYFKPYWTNANINNSTADPIGTEYKFGGAIIN